MSYINNVDFKKLKEYIISIYNTSDELCVLVKKEYFKGKNFKNIQYLKTVDDNKIEKIAIKNLYNYNGKIKIKTFISKEEADYERQTKRK